MAVDVLKKLRKEARARQQRPPPTARGAAGGEAVPPAKLAPAPQHEPGLKYFVSSNWKSLLARKPKVAPKAAAAQSATLSGAATGGVVGTSVVAIDCEMVGVGPDGNRSVLARVSIVDHEGKVLLDKFVRPQERVTDMRTEITGITAWRLKQPDVLKEEAARKLASELIEGKVVVGHALHNDFKALSLTHPDALIRDTSLFKPLRIPGREKRTPALRHLVEHWLHEKIHEGHHDSVEDARMALRLYHLKSRIWERQMRSAMRMAAEGGEDDEEAADADDGEPVDRHDGGGGDRGAGAEEGRGRRVGKRRKKRHREGQPPTSSPPARKRPLGGASAGDGRKPKRRRVSR